MNLDINLTVLLVLKDRAEYTYRWMSYMQYINFPYPIIIADGGKNQEISNLLRENKQFPDLNFKYFRYDFDQNLSFFYSKIDDVMSKISTKYLLLADNDDFLQLEGITKSVCFMEQNPSYNSCRGLVYGVDITETKKSFSPIEQSFNIMYNSKNIDDSATTSRLYYHLANYAPSWYNTYRVDNFKQKWRELKNVNFKDVFLMEHFLSLSNVAVGKIKVLSTPYLVRQLNPVTSCANEDKTKNGSLVERMLDENWQNEFKILLHEVHKNHSCPQKEEKERYFSAIRKGYAEYIKSTVLTAESILKSEETAISLILTYCSNNRILQKIVRNKICGFIYAHLHKIAYRQQEKRNNSSQHKIPFILLEKFSNQFTKYKFRNTS